MPFSLHPLSAQPPARILFNASFEAPVICNTPASTCWQLVPVASVPGWSVETDNVVEFWRNNYGSVRAQDGNQHIELNANNPSNVFLNVCLLQNENVTLTFHHRARPNNAALGAATIDVMEVLATNLVSGTVAVSNITATNVPDAIGTTWTGVGTVSDIAANSFRVNSRHKAGHGTRPP